MLFTHCLCLLEQCTSHEDLRTDLVERYKFQTVLAMYLNKNNDRKTIRRILRLLNELTYGIQITWSEPYLNSLVHRLFEIIGYKDEANESASLALSVLVNLAYKNPPVIELFYTMINTEFLKSIQSFGVLTNKMYYLLGQNSPKDLLASVHLYFKEIDRTQKAQLASEIGRTVDFALDVFRREIEFMRTNKQLINEHLDTLLGSLGNMDSQGGGGAALGPDQTRCMAKILEFFYVLIELELMEEAQYHRVVYFASKLIKSHASESHVVRHALEVLQIGAQRFQDKASLLSSLEDQIPRLLSRISEQDVRCRLSVLKFLRAFVKDKAFESLFLGQVTESFFRDMFAPLLTWTTESAPQQVLRMTNDEVLFHLLALTTLTCFSSVAPVQWFDLVIEFFKSRNVQLVIVEGLVRHTEDMSQQIFELAKVVEFPAADIAQIFAAKYVPPPPHQEPPQLTIEKQNPVMVSRQQCERIDEILDELDVEMSNNRGGVLQRLEMANVIHLCQHQRNVARTTEKNYELRLQQASDQINCLTHRQQLMESEMATLQNSYFSLELFQSNMNSESQRNQKVADELKRDILNYKTKHDTMKAHYDKLLVACQEKAKQREAEMKASLKQLSEEFEEMVRSGSCSARG